MSHAPITPAAAAAITPEQMVVEIQRLGAEVSKLQAQLSVAHSASSSSSSSSSSASVSSPHPNIKVSLAPHKPPVFDGKTPVMQWSGAVDRWLNACGISDPAQQLTQVVTFLDPSLGYWWDSVKAQCTTWSLMKQAMKERWQPVAQAKLARTALDSLRQRGSVTDYHNKFLAVTLLIDNMTDDEKLHAFKRGLVPRLREKIECSGQQYDTLASVVHAATMAEEQRRQFMNTQFSHSSSSYSRPAAAASTASSFSSSSAPMEISHIGSNDREDDDVYTKLWEEPTAAAAPAATAAIASGTNETTVVLKQLLNAISGFKAHGSKQQQASAQGGGKLGKLTPEDRQRLFAENRCFRCRKVGHRSTECRGGSSSKLTPSPQQSEK
jgi:hypothetical protein